MLCSEVGRIERISKLRQVTEMIVRINRTASLCSFELDKRSSCWELDEPEKNPHREGCRPGTCKPRGDRKPVTALRLYGGLGFALDQDVHESTVAEVTTDVKRDISCRHG